MWMTPKGLLSPRGWGEQSKIGPTYISSIGLTYRLGLPVGLLLAYDVSNLIIMILV